MERSLKIRWQIPFVLLVSVLISYFDRMNISYALPVIAKDYGWGVEEIEKNGGLLMSIFFVGYGLANICLSPLGERIGPRKSLIIIVILFSGFTFLQSPFGLMFMTFVAMRFLLGVSEGIHFPMMSTLMKKWFPLHERSRANGIWICGIFLAMILAPIIIVPIIEHMGWRNMFVVMSISGVLITIPLIYFFVYDSPEDHPSIDKKEIQYINSGLEPDEGSATSLIEGIKQLTVKPDFWLAFLGGTLNNITSFGLISWIPTYFTESRGLAYSNLAYAASISYVFSIIGVACWSYLGDKTNRRATIAGIGFYGSSLLTYYAATAANIHMAVLFFSITIFLNVAYISNEFAIIQRIIPRSQIAAGTGLYNGLAMMLGGGIGPILVGSVVSATGDYTKGILVLALIPILSGTIMLILGRRIKY
jgi:MFS family permease